ncbi:MAG TPA: CinA family protein [Hyphomicrobiaceae bacterium]|jgi:nicotinamide-nucleotide amidase|nr:CinA family protein [Hyphomicrobiaceae bacterium]
MFSQHLTDIARELLKELRNRAQTLATAESCTGGLVAGLLTEIPGSSDVLDRGFITYSNAAKTEMLGVSAALIAKHGAVSEPVARAMAEGAIRGSRADLAVSITGVAGPGGGTPDKPVGLVHFAATRRGGPTIATHHRFGDVGRSRVRLLSVEAALRLLEQMIAARS